MAKIGITINGKNLASKAINEVRKDLASTDSTAQKLSSTLDGLGKLAIAGAVSTIGTAVTGLVKSIKEAASMETIETSFGVLIKDAALTKATMQDLIDFAAKTPLEMAGISSVATVLLASGSAAADVREELQMLGDIAMGNQEKLGRLANAYAKVQTKGKASLKEINMFSEAGVPLVDAMSENLKKTNKEVLELITKGKVGFPEVQKALESLTSEGGQFFRMMEQQSQTLSGKWSTFKDNVNISFADLGRKLLPDVKKALDSISTAFSDIISSEGFTNLVSSTVKWVNWMVDRIPRIVAVVSFLGTAFGAVGRYIGREFEEFRTAASNIPLIRFSMEVVGDVYEALKKGLQTGDWTDLFGSMKTALSMSIVFVGIATAASLLWKALSITALPAAGFLRSLGVGGVIAGASIAIAFAEAKGSGSWFDFGANMVAALAAGIGIGAFAGSPKLGALVFTIVLNLELGEFLAGNVSDYWTGLVDGAKETGKNVIEGFSEVVDNPEPVKRITWFWDSIVKGFENALKRPILGPWMKNQLKDAQEAAEINSPSKYTTWMGRMLARGLDIGLDGTPEIMAQNAEAGLLAMKDVLDIHSPSGETEWMGWQLMRGFIKGIKDPQLHDELSSAFEKMLDTFKAAASSVEADIASILPGGKNGGKIAANIKTKVTWGDVGGAIWNGVKNLPSAIWSGIKGISSSIWDGLKELPGAIWDGIKNLPDAIATALDESSTGFKDKLKEQVGSTEVGKLTGYGLGSGDEPKSIMKLFGSGLAGMVTSLVSVQALLNPISTMLSGMMDVLRPLIDSALSPILGILTTFGRFLGSVIAPVFKLLGVVTEQVGKAFVWIYNNILVPIGNGLITLFNLIYNGFVSVINGIIWALNWIPFVNIDYIPTRNLDADHLKPIGYSDVTASASSYTGSGANTGSSTSVSSTNVTIYQTIQGNVIGDGGMAALGRFLNDALTDFVGGGGRITFAEEIA